MHDSLKGFLVTVLIAGVAIMYIATRPTNAFTTFFALPLAGVLAICLMPNRQWLIGALAVYLLPVIVFVWGLVTSEDMDAGSTFLLIALGYISASSVVGLVVRQILRNAISWHLSGEDKCT